MSVLKFEWQRAVMNSDLPPGTRFVLMILCSFMDADGRNCFPTRETIAKAAGMSTRRVTPHLQRAVDDGWLVRWERRSAEPLSGRAAQGWRHYQYAAAIPTPERGDVLSPPSSEAEQEKGENVGTFCPHLTPERGDVLSPPYPRTWGRFVPLIIKDCNQSSNSNRESARAPAPSVFQDQSKGQNQAANPKPSAGKQAGRGARFDLEEIPRSWGLWASEFCETSGLDLDIRGQFEKFASYWQAKPGQGACKADWQAAWRNWWLRELDYARQDPRRAAAIEDQRKADAARRRQEVERLAAAEKTQADQVEQAARKAAEEERAASGRVCGNCLNLGGVHPLLKSFRTCEFSKSRMASPDRAPDCESFSRRTDATIQCRRSETTP